MHRPLGVRLVVVGRAGSANWLRDRLYEANLENLAPLSALDAFHASFCGPAAEAAPPLTGAGLWCEPPPARQEMRGFMGSNVHQSRAQQHVTLVHRTLRKLPPDRNAGVPLAGIIKG